MYLFHWFDAHCAWIYNNMCIFRWMFSDAETSFGAAILKCLLQSVWFVIIIYAPLLIILRGVGYIIGGWTGWLPAFFFKDDD